MKMDEIEFIGGSTICTLTSPEPIELMNVEFQRYIQGFNFKHFKKGIYAGRTLNVNKK